MAESGLEPRYATFSLSAAFPAGRPPNICPQHSVPTCLALDVQRILLEIRTRVPLVLSLVPVNSACLFLSSENESYSRIYTSARRVLINWKPLQAFWGKCENKITLHLQILHFWAITPQPCGRHGMANPKIMTITLVLL